METIKKKRILLAINNDAYAKILFKHFSDSLSFDVYPNPIYHIKYLMEFISDQKPDIVILHDKHFGLEAKESHDREVEWLRFIEVVRRKYDDDIRFVFLCEREVGDPFLSELISRNVRDIFYNRSIDIAQLIQQLLDAPRYSNVAHLLVKDSKMKYDDSEVYAPWKNDSKEDTDVAEITVPLNTSESIEPLHEEVDGSVTEEDFNKSIFPKPEIEPHDVLDEDKKRTIKFPKFPSIPKFRFSKKERTEPNEEAGPKQEEVKKKRRPLVSINRPGSVQPMVPPKLIAVGSIHPGAGSTFLLHNFSRDLSELGVPVSLVDANNEYDALYSLFAAEQSPPDHWESLQYVMSQGFKNVSFPRWQFDEVTVFAQRGVEEKELNVEMTKELLFAARQSPIVFVDISHNWDDPISQEALRICDELWCVTEPNAHYIHAIRSKHKDIYQVSNRVGEDSIIVIGNRWAPGADLENIPEIYTEIPYFKENVKALNAGLPLFQMKPKLFSKAFRKLEDRILVD